MNNHASFDPKRLYKSVVENIAFPPPSSPGFSRGRSRELFFDCALASWEVAAKWQSACIHHLMKEEKYDIVFSHFHNVDIQDHTFYKYMAEGTANMTRQIFVELSQEIYKQTDRYLGSYLHLLDEGWTVFVVSDHGLVTHGNQLPLIGDMNGLNVGLMQELGFTVLQKDENGNDIKAVDWTKTKAVANRGCHIYLNLKGRNATGIVEPEDKWEVEEEIMTALYGYKHPVTGKRVIALALRNKDAVLLGLGGPESGDIIVYRTAEGYNLTDHTDSFIHHLPESMTPAASPIFIAAGRRYQRKLSKPTAISAKLIWHRRWPLLGGVRMPHECEGAPAYQILAPGDGIAE